MTVPRSNASHDQNHVPTLMGVSTTDGTTPVPVEVDPTTGQLQVSSTGGGGGGAATLADGADVAEGATTDAAVTAGSSGTVSGKLRQISADLATTVGNQTNGTQQTKLTDGTNTANVLKSDGTAAGQNAVKIAGAYQELSGLSAASLNADLVPSTDVSGYKWISLQLLGTWVATISFQGSNDNTNWVNVTLIGSTSTSNVNQTTTTSNAILHGPINYRYFRARLTAYTSGTMTGVLELFTQPSQLHTMGVAAQQTGTWTVGSNSATGSAIPANAFYIAGFDGTNLTGLQVRTPGDSVNVISGTLMTHAETALYNGTQWDRARSNEAATLLVSAARTTTQTSADLVNYNGKSALIVTLDMTTVGTGSVTVSINRKDSASGKYITILTGSAITTNSTNVYKVGPDIAAAANSIAQDYLGRTFQIVVTANNANSATYSVGYELVR